MNLLVNGGTKFIGRAVVDRALELGHKVAVYHRGETEPQEMPKVLHIHGDNAKIMERMDEIQAFAPDAVIDTTQFDRPRTEAVVATLTGVIARYVLVSSMDVYMAYGRLHRTELGPYQEMLRSETSELRTKPGFGHTEEIDNLHIENVALSQNDLNVTIARLPGVFGPHDYQRRVGEMVDNLRKSGSELRMHPLRADFHWTWGYVENIADMLIECALDRRPGNNIYNLGFPEALSVMEMHQLTARVIEWGGQIVATENGTELPKQDLKQQWGSDTSKFRKDFGYNERFSMEEAFNLTVDHISELDHSETD
jgi:nucleoside-diphosphate-sugar epimerase